MRKLFDVYINSKPYVVYDIEGKEHAGYNAIPKTWWLYFSKGLPEVEGVTVSKDSLDLHPFSSSIKRLVWEIKIAEKNSVKEKWGDYDFRSGCWTTMIANGKEVYSFPTLDMEYACARVQVLKHQLMEHPYNFFEPEKERGRKIFFYNLPAMIEPSTAYPGEISIIPEYTKYFPKEIWWKEYSKRSIIRNLNHQDLDAEEEIKMDEESLKEDMGYDKINWGDALSDGHIWWFRD